MEKLRVAAVSTRNWIGQADRSIKNMAAWAAKAADQGAEFVLFPELGVNGYFKHESVWDVAEPVPGPSTEKLVALAASLNLILCFGLLENDADITYNTQVLVNGNGIIGKQRKIHMPGKEYLYWRGGDKIETFDIGKARVGITICYDSLFPEMVRTLYMKGAEIILMPFAYNTKMPRARFPQEDMTALTYRTLCYLNGCYGIVSNNAGIRRKNQWEPKGKRFPGWAGVFGPDGSVVSFTQEKGRGESMVVTDLMPEQIAIRRRNPHFTPRTLRPETYYNSAES